MLLSQVTPLDAILSALRAPGGAAVSAHRGSATPAATAAAAGADGATVHLQLFAPDSCPGISAGPGAVSETAQLGNVEARVAALERALGICRPDGVTVAATPASTSLSTSAAAAAAAADLAGDDGEALPIYARLRAVEQSVVRLNPDHLAGVSQAMEARCAEARDLTAPPSLLPTTWRRHHRTALVDAGEGV